MDGFEKLPGGGGGGEHILGGSAIRKIRVFLGIYAVLPLRFEQSPIRVRRQVAETPQPYRRTFFIFGFGFRILRLGTQYRV